MSSGKGSFIRSFTFIEFNLGIQKLYYYLYSEQLTIWKDIWTLQVENENENEKYYIFQTSNYINTKYFIV